MKNRFIIILIALLTYAIFLIFKNPQPYGKLAMLPITLLVIFGFIKKRILRNILMSIALIAISLIFIVGTRSLLSNTTNQELFNQETPVKFSKLTFEEALLFSKETNKPLFIDFYTVWCGPCIQFHKEVLTDKSVASKMNKAFINLKYNIYEGEGNLLREKYGVSYVPRFVIINDLGEIIEDINTDSILTKERMIKISNNYLK
ncbi:thioredoxin family protein [Pontimicrobium sp. SW4]|uniref:Thioredoxin family protein n=1 Tax=Pontimicrobium sp. SW4 TaxID=3153519 RepID=A0AAU7BVP7_9FLAO